MPTTTFAAAAEPAPKQTKPQARPTLHQQSQMQKPFSTEVEKGLWNVVSFDSPQIPPQPSAISRR
jgi:hypothetical protein